MLKLHFSLGSGAIGGGSSAFGPGGQQTRSRWTSWWRCQPWFWGWRILHEIPELINFKRWMCKKMFIFSDWMGHTKNHIIKIQTSQTFIFCGEKWNVLHTFLIELSVILFWSIDKFRFIQTILIFIIQGTRNRNKSLIERGVMGKIHEISSFHVQWNSFPNF